MRGPGNVIIKFEDYIFVWGHAEHPLFGANNNINMIRFDNLCTCGKCVQSFQGTGWLVGWLVGSCGISNNVNYLMKNPVYPYILNIYDL